MSRQEIINAEMHLANKVQNGAYLADTVDEHLKEPLVEIMNENNLRCLEDYLEEDIFRLTGITSNVELNPSSITITWGTTEHTYQLTCGTHSWIISETDMMHHAIHGWFYRRHVMIWTVLPSYPDINPEHISEPRVTVLENEIPTHSLNQLPDWYSRHIWEKENSPIITLNAPDLSPKIEPS